ncbi:MAG: carboxypeptidase-like regulatory domain-containing protein, partial [Acidobacteriota bacterium]
MRLLACLLALSVFLVAQPPPARLPVTSDCSLDGSVVNAATGEPVARARVMLMGPRGQTGVTADNAGRWSFSNAACGQTQILAMKPGFLQGSFGQPRLGAAFRPVILAGGEALHDLKIQLTPQAVVTGKAVDDQGDPMMGVQISALAPRVMEGRRAFQPGVMVTTNDLGEYRLAGLQPGKYILCAQAPGLFNGLDPGDGSTVAATR